MTDDADDAGDSDVCAAALVALGLAVNNPVAHGGLGGGEVVALRREVVAAQDVVVVAGARFGVENGFQAIGPRR